MKNVKRGRIVVIAAVLAVILAGAAIGAAVVKKGSDSDRTKTLELLSQVQDKLFSSCISDYLGYGELMAQAVEKGSVYNVQASGIKIYEELPQLEDLDGEISDFVLKIGARYDNTKNVSRIDAELAKDDTAMTAVLYTEPDKIMAALPELLKDKVLVTTEGTESIEPLLGPHLTLEEIAVLGEDARAFVKEELEHLHGEIVCSRLDNGQSGFTFTIPQTTVETMLADAITFLEGEEEFVHYINYQRNAYQTEGEETFDLIAALNNYAASVKGKISDFTFEVYEEKETVTGMKATIQSAETVMNITVDFDGVPGDSTVTIRMEDGRSEGESFALVWKDTKGEVYENSLGLEWTEHGKTHSVRMTDSLNPKDNTYRLDVESDVLTLKAKGAVKDLIKGNNMDYVLDEVSVFVNGERYADFSLNLQIGVLDGSIEPPEGEQVEDAFMTESNLYLDEIAESLSNIFVKWGVSAW